MTRIAALAASRAIGLAFVATLVVWWLALRPVGLGGPVSYVVIRGTSMLPTYETGDLVITRTSTDYRTGDVIAYRVPAGEVGEGRIVVHRIVGGDAVNGYLMRGDNNPTEDPWMPRAADVVGRPWLWFSQIGRAIALLHQPASLGALASAIAVMFVVFRGGAATKPEPDRRGRGLDERRVPAL